MHHPLISPASTCKASFRRRRQTGKARCAAAGAAEPLPPAGDSILGSKENSDSSEEEELNPKEELTAKEELTPEQELTPDGAVPDDPDLHGARDPKSLVSSKKSQSDRLYGSFRGSSCFPVFMRISGIQFQRLLHRFLFDLLSVRKCENFMITHRLRNFSKPSFESNKLVEIGNSGEYTNSGEYNAIIVHMSIYCRSSVLGLTLGQQFETLQCVHSVQGDANEEGAVFCCMGSSESGKRSL